MANLLDSLSFNLKRLRQEKGVKTQAELAKASGVNLGVIKKAEAGLVVPQTSNLALLAKVLKVEETELFRDPSEIREPSIHEAVAVLLKKLEPEIGHYVRDGEKKKILSARESSSILPGDPLVEFLSGLSDGDRVRAVETLKSHFGSKRVDTDASSISEVDFDRLRNHLVSLIDSADEGDLSTLMRAFESNLGTVAPGNDRDGVETRLRRLIDGTSPDELPTLVKIAERYLGVGDSSSSVSDQPKLRTPKRR